MDQASYLLALRSAADGRPPVSCGHWSLCHSTCAEGLRKTIEIDRPSLLSKRVRGGKVAEGDDNGDFVFAYAAPRIKGVKAPAAVLVFASQTLQTSMTLPEEVAHPFDSGGLRRHAGLRREKAALTAALTFAPWRPSLGLFIAALFDEPERYLRGAKPDRLDPLGIQNGLMTHDPLFFTWEVKTRDRIEYRGRLVGVLLTEGPQSRVLVSDSVRQGLRRRVRDGEIVLRTVPGDPDVVAEELVRMYGLPAPQGWR